MNDVVASLTEIAGLAEGMIWHLALVFLRVGAAVSLLPAFGEQALPQRIRLSVAVALTMVVAPGVEQASGPPGPVAFLSEAVIGLLLGLSLRLMILALQTAGTIAAQSVSLAQMFAGTGPEPQPVIANLLVLAGIAVFLASGGAERAVLLLLLSYDMVPTGVIPSPEGMVAWGLSRIASTFSLAFSLAAPFVLAALLYNLALGLINRAMPALMVTFIGAPALSLGGLALLALAAPIVLEVWRNSLEAVLARPFGM